MTHTSDTSPRSLMDYDASDMFSVTPGGAANIMRKIRHDANGHLRGVIELTKLLEQQEKSGTDKCEMLRLIRESGENARRLVSGITAFAEYYSAAIAPKTMDVDTLIQDIIAESEIKRASDAYRITIMPVGTIEADADMLRTLLHAVIDNAFHYFSHHAKNRYIDIRAEHTETTLLLDVSDSGIGMKPEFFERGFIITERMQTHDNYPGAGIGLTTARMIARRHGGDVSFIAPHPRFKTTVRITWPL